MVSEEICVYELVYEYGFRGVTAARKTKENDSTYSYPYSFTPDLSYPKSPITIASDHPCC